MFVFVVDGMPVTVQREIMAALLGTPAAALRTFSAMVVMVLGALLGARIADVGANLQDLPFELAIAAEQRQCRRTDHGTILVQRDAGGHHRHVVLAEAGMEAPIALDDTIGEAHFEFFGFLFHNVCVIGFVPMIVSRQKRYQLVNGDTV
jgi:hypothetical protein